MKLSTIIFLTLLLSFPILTWADSYCEPMSKSDLEAAPWYIPESAFTKEAANTALANLQSQVNGGVAGRDFMVNNDLRMIKGYLYLSYLEEHKKQFGEVDTVLRGQFCSFLKEAIVEH